MFLICAKVLCIDLTIPSDDSRITANFNFIIVKFLKAIRIPIWIIAVTINKTVK